MRRVLVFGTAASLVGLAALGSGGEAQGQPSDADAVRAAASAFYAALNARDIGAMEPLWAQDADPIMIHPSGPFARSPAVGWETVRKLSRAADWAEHFGGDNQSRTPQHIETSPRRDAGDQPLSLLQQALMMSSSSGESCGSAMRS